MKRATLNFFAASLLVLSGLPAGLSGYYKLKQLWVRSMMEERLEQAHLETLTLHPHQLVWHKKGKEILIQNRLFDIKSMEVAGDRVTVTGIYDDAETAIKEKIASLESRQQRDNERSRSLLFRLHSLLHYYEDCNGQWRLTPPESPATRHTCYQLRILNPFSPICIPPPKA